MQVTSDGADGKTSAFTTAEGLLRYTIAEWNTPKTATYNWETAQASLATASPGTFTGCTPNTEADLLKLPRMNLATTVTGDAFDGTTDWLAAIACQGCNAEKYPQALHHRFAGDGTGVKTNAYLALEWIAAKNAEYKAFNTEKAAYDTKRADYDKKLEAAEKVTDAQAKDIFKLWFPTKEDTDAIKAVPVRPSKPTAPAAYQGPPVVAKETTATNQKVGFSLLEE